MTKQLTRQEVEAVVERLIPENQLCDLGIERCDTCKLQPVLLGTVLEKMQNRLKYIVCTACYTGCRENPHGTEEYTVSEVYAKFLHLWAMCGVSKSLQEIVEASGWKEDWCSSCNPHSQIHTAAMCQCSGAEVLKSPEANELFTFLQEIL